MSTEVVFECAVCSKTINGRQHFAICLLCQKRVHRKCYGDSLSKSLWEIFRQTFICSTCKAGVVAGDADKHVPNLASHGPHFNSNYCSDGERQLVIGESMDKTFDVSTYVPPTNVQYEIKIGASRKGGDIVSDGCGYTYSFQIDYLNLRVWRCTFRGCVQFPRCNSTLKQIKMPGVDFLRNYSQEDFTKNAEKAHCHPPNYGVEERQLTVGRSSSTITGTSIIDKFWILEFFYGLRFSS